VTGSQSRPSFGRDNACFFSGYFFKLCIYENNLAFFALLLQRQGAGDAQESGSGLRSGAAEAVSALSLFLRNVITMSR
jgi:hypothetical protein